VWLLAVMEMRHDRIVSDRLSTADEQLAVIGGLHDELIDQAIPHWLFGGWAVDFHVGRVTRIHDDIDIAVLAADARRVHDLLSQRGWDVVDEADGYRTYRRGDVHVDVAWVDDDDPEWPPDAFGDDTRELGGHRTSVISRRALLADKSAALGDPAKDASDVDALEAAGG
jgi:hypothetical protein